jgi:AraC-like DNA-binding protein
MERKELVELTRRISMDSSSTHASFAESQNFVHSAAIIGSASFPVKRREKARECIDRLQHILEESPQTPLTLADLAQLLNLERTYCCKLFQELTGACLSQWMRKIRIASAQRMLRVSAYTITEVSQAVGYDDITTFSRNFRKELGLSPRTFRRLSMDSND